MRKGDGLTARREGAFLRQSRRQRVGDQRREDLQDRVDEASYGTGRQARQPRVDRHHPTRVDRLLVLVRQGLELGPLQDQTAAAVAGDRRLAVQDHVAAGRQGGAQVRLIKEDDADRAGVVLYQGLEDGQPARARSAQDRCHDPPAHSRPQPRDQGCDRKEPAAVLITEWQVEEKIFDGAQAALFEITGPLRAEPSKGMKGRGQLEHAAII